MMRVTLYCDASWSDEHRVGAWAVWLRSGVGRIVRAGHCPAYCDSSTSAELAAIFAGMHIATTKWFDVTRILVRSDCKSALDAMLTPAAPASMQRLQNRIVTLIGMRGISVDPRWCPGHAGQGDTAGFVNNQVHRLAYDTMKQMVANLQSLEASRGPDCAECGGSGENHATRGPYGDPSPCFACNGNGNGNG